MLKQFRGIRIHPSIRISKDRESRHIAIIGGIGSGKTQILRYLTSRIQKRLAKNHTHKAVLYGVDRDIKIENPDRVFRVSEETLSNWIVGQDITSMEEAEILASHLFPSLTNADPFWEHSAQNLLSAIIWRLCETQKTHWRLTDLLPAIQATGDDKLQREVPGGNDLPMFSVLKEMLLSRLGSVLDSMKKDKDKNEIPGQTFSLTEWLNGPKQFLLLSGRWPTGYMRQLVIPAMLSLLARRMSASNRPSDHRVWFVLDEFPTLGRINNFLSISEQIRSFGGAIVWVAQDLAQLDKLYGPEGRLIFTVGSGTTILCRTSSDSVSAVSGIPKGDILSLGPTKTGVDAVLLLDQKAERKTWAWQKAVNI